MTTVNFSASRTTTLLSSNNLLASLRRTQSSLLGSQSAISTGRLVNRPSDMATRTSAILAVQAQLEARAQYNQNLNAARGVVDNADAALADATDILLEARTIASSQVGVGSNTDTRRNQAEVIDAQVRAIVDIANRQYGGVTLFGGAYNGGRADKQVFEDFLGGVRYVGARENLSTDLGLERALAINSNGQDAFNALSARVRSNVDLNPSATVATRLDDLAGAQGLGVRRGAVVVEVDGVSVNVDLSSAGTLGDVTTRINHAIATVNPAAGSLAVSSGTGGLSLSVNAGATVEIREQGTGQTASDLGLLTGTIAGPGTHLGADLDPRLTELTALSSLGVTVDWDSGLQITQGAHTKVVSFTGSVTVQDLINKVDQAQLGVRMEIAGDGRSLSLVSEVSGLVMSIGENAGGSTATDLGLRSMMSDTLLADLRFGDGVEQAQGRDDFRVLLRDGSSFDVNIDGAETVGDVIAAVRSAAEAALGAGNVGGPGDAGTLFNIGLAPDGNGLSLEDGSAGGGEFRVQQLGTSMAAENLGIYQSAGAGSSIVGADRAGVRVESVMTHLMMLRDALRADDSRGITVAGSKIETDLDDVARARADLGVRSQRVSQQLDRSQELEISEQSLLSDLRDADVTEVITRYTQLMQQLEASLRAGGTSMQLSLLDFLR